MFASLYFLPAAACAQNKVEASSRKSVADAPSKQAIGQLIFHDTSLSHPPGQSCASCHKTAFAFADNTVVSEGAVKGAFVNRNAPSLKYGHFSGLFVDSGWGNLRGGFFWDGRADTLEEQALGPFYNPLEMSSTPSQLAAALKASTYFQWLVQHYGEAIKNNDELLIDSALDALAAFQSSEIFSPFDSKFDYAKAGLIELSTSEKRGEDIFNNKGLCADCHLSDQQEFGGRQLFTNFSYQNIGVPKNPDLPIYARQDSAKPDLGIFTDEGITANPKFSENYVPPMMGAFKTPTLRNIALTAPYMHNGVFATLEEVVDFYNDMEKFWPPEVKNLSGLVSTKLALTDQEKSDLIAFMKALTDGYAAPEPMRKALRQHQREAQVSPPAEG